MTHTVWDKWFEIFVSLPISEIRPLLKSLIKLPRPAAAAAYIHCQELLDSLVWTFENQVSEGAMRNNGRLDKDEVLKLEEKVLERLDFDVIELRKMMLAKWLLNEGRLKLPYTVSGIEGLGETIIKTTAKSKDKALWVLFTVRNFLTI